MPVLLKNKTKNSPGIICFNHNEALFGVPAKFNNVKKILTKLSLNREWVFGVHVQGDLSWYGKWKREGWQDFFMWSNKNDFFLEDVAKEDITELTCINFYNNKIFKKRDELKIYDLCNISRFSSIKKIDLTLSIFKKILEHNINLKLLLIAPYPSLENRFNFLSKEERYINNTLKNIKNIFNTQELNQIDFICSNSNFFGNFPVKNETLYNLIHSSKNLLLNSHQEGVPRVIIEALCLNTKVIISNKLKSGIQKYLNYKNSFVFNEIENKYSADENASLISNQIIDYINRKDLIDIKDNQSNFFNEDINIPRLKNFFSTIFNKKKNNFDNKEEDWHLYNLNKRLACHGHSMDLYFYNNDKAFFNWFEKIKNAQNNRCEDFLYGESSKLDKKINYTKKIIFWIRYYTSRIIYKFKRYNQ